MRMPPIAATVATVTILSAALLAETAAAQTTVVRRSAPMVMHQQGGATIQRGPINNRTVIVGPRYQQRWGGTTNGRWYAGGDAPGGWKAYRRPTRGWAMPRYWLAPNFYVGDWSNYGLAAPASGYNWTRYYDDAVLVDGRGRVQDSVSNVDWYGGYNDVDEETYAEAGPNDGGYGGYHNGPDGQPPVAGAGYPPPPVGPLPAPVRRRDSGIGGALVGGAVGGVAGNLIAGKGNRLAGTLVGAGVGAIAGAAIDRAGDRGPGRRPLPGYAPPPPGADYRDGRSYDGRGYDERGYDGYAPRGHVQTRERRIYRGPGPAPVYQGNGVTVVTSGAGGYGYGYAYAPTTTVVTVQPAVTTTTTTTEYVYESVAARKVVKRWKAKLRCVCAPIKTKLVRR